MNRIIKWLRNRLPVSYGTYMEDLENLKTVIDAIIQNEKQHSQIEMNLVKNVNNLTLANQAQATSSDKDQENDVAFN